MIRKHLEFSVEDRDSTIKEIQLFRDLVKSQWSIDLASLTLKNLNKKASKKAALIPLTEDTMKLSTHECDEIAYGKLVKNQNDMKMYKVLSETALISANIHNQKRAGDVHFFKLDDFIAQTECASKSKGTQAEFLNSLAESERILMNSYVKLNSTGKGSRNESGLKYYNLLYKICEEQDGKWFSEKNVFFFTLPRWLCGITALRKYGKASKAQHPKLLTTSRLCKQIATVTQLLSLRENEID